MYLVMEREKRAATWRIVLAAILDFLTAFFVLGFLIVSLWRDDRGWFSAERITCTRSFRSGIFVFLGGQKVLRWDPLEAYFKSAVNFHLSVSGLAQDQPIPRIGDFAFGGF